MLAQSPINSLLDGFQNVVIPSDAAVNIVEHITLFFGIIMDFHVLLALFSCINVYLFNKTEVSREQEQILCCPVTPATQNEHHLGFINIG